MNNMYIFIQVLFDMDNCPTFSNKVCEDKAVLIVLDNLLSTQRMSKKLNAIISHLSAVIYGSQWNECKVSSRLLGID